MKLKHIVGTQRIPFFPSLIPPLSPDMTIRPHLRVYCLHKFMPRSPLISQRALFFIRVAIYERRGHIIRHIGHPNWYDWVIWYVFLCKLNYIANLFHSYHFHSSTSEIQSHWTVRSVDAANVSHTLHVFDDGRRAESFNNGGRYWGSRKMHRWMYEQIY
jgi:hypothetical protein